MIPAATQNALRTLEWIDRAEVLCVCGPSGTGKSHLIEALGHLAIDKSRTVAWHTPETLAQLLRRHRADDTVSKAIGKLIRVDLLRRRRRPWSSWACVARGQIKHPAEVSARLRVLLGGRELSMNGLRRALIVAAAAAFVAAGSSPAARTGTIARARDVVYAQDVAGSSDAGTLTVGSHNPTGVLWSARSDQLGTALNGHAGPVSSVAFSSNGGTLATATENGTVQLWDVRSNTLVGTLKGLTGIVDSVAFSPNGRTLAAGARDGTVLLWNVQSRRQLGTALTAHAGSVYSVAFSPDALTLAAASANGTVVLWSVRRHTRLATLNNHAGAIGSVVFGAHGDTSPPETLTGRSCCGTGKASALLGSPSRHTTSSVASRSVRMGEPSPPEMATTGRSRCGTCNATG